MKKIFTILAFAFIMFSTIGCSRIETGYIGLEVDLMGDEKGAVKEVPPGWYFNISPSVDYKSFPLFVQTYKWTEGKDEGSPNDEAIRFQTAEGLQITADIGVTFSINPEAGTAKTLFLRYRRGVEEIIDGVMRNAVRDAFNKYGSLYTADQIIGNEKNKLIDSVQADVTEKFAPELIVQDLSWLSSPRPPQNVIDALNAKVQATQLAIQKENEVRSATAEAQKMVEASRGKAESIRLEAEAQAEANKLLSASLSANLIQLKWIEAWDGKLPTVQGAENAMMNLGTFGSK